MKNYMVTFAPAPNSDEMKTKTIIMSESEVVEAKRDICNSCPYKFSLCDSYCRNGIIASEEGTPTDLEPTIVRIEEV